MPQYIGHGDGKATIEQVLKFCTGLSSVPPMGLPEPISVRFLSSHRSSVLPKADSCFGVIKLPVIHTTQQAFYENMDIGITYSLNYYGRM